MLQAFGYVDLDCQRQEKHNPAQVLSEYAKQVSPETIFPGNNTASFTTLRTYANLFRKAYRSYFSPKVQKPEIKRIVEDSSDFIQHQKLPYYVLYEWARGSGRDLKSETLRATATVYK